MNKKVGRSKQLSNVSRDARLMFLLMLPHADREGRLEAEPDVLNGVVFTRMDFTEEEIVAALQELHDVQLVRLYEVDGTRYLYFPKFEQNQQGLRKDREAASEIPEPPSSKKTSSKTAGGGNAPEELRSPPEEPGLRQDKTKRRSKEKNPPTPLKEPRTVTPRGGLEELANENALQTLKRTAPRVHEVFEEIARLQRSRFDAKVAQAKALLDRITEKGSPAVEDSLRTILATAGDGGPLFTRAMRHLEKHHQPQVNLTRARKFEGYEPGRLARLPDGEAHVITGLDEVGQWVLFDDHEPVRPSECELVVLN